MSQPTSIRNSSGFTLVEVMVAILIMMVGMIGLLEMINVSLQHNLKNQLRDEAVQVGERYMAELRGTPFDDISLSYQTIQVPSKLRGSTREYSVARISQVLARQDPANAASSPTSLQLTVTVSWDYRNATLTNRVVSVVARP